MRDFMARYVWDKATDVVSVTADLAVWGAAFETADRCVARDEISTPFGEVVVYSSFLGMDHNFSDAGPPLFFETMATVDGDWCDLQYRYSSSKDALNLHRALVAHVREGKHPDTFGAE